jgi:hypothetical protein
LDIGGKPANSTLAFIPITFELTVLLGGLATVGALFLRTRLYLGKREQLPVAGVTNNKFAIVVRKPDTGTQLRRAHTILWANGAVQVEEKVTDL